jgi:type I restriction enzyme M protein
MAQRGSRARVRSRGATAPTRVSSSKITPKTPTTTPVSSTAILRNDKLRKELLEAAQERGYLTISGSRIKYYCRREFEDDFTDPEELVRATIYAWLILEKSYPAAQIDLEVSVPRRTPSDWADIVVYQDEACRAPYLVVECKPRKISARDRTQAVEQAFGNANSYRVTHFALFDNIDESRLYAIQGHPPDERESNHLGPRDALPADFGRAAQYRLIAGGALDIAPFPARDLENRVRRAHGMIWAGGKRDPLRAFDEWCKLLFAKIHDERNTPNGNPRLFQVGAGESTVRVGSRIRDLYRAAIKADPTIFSKPIDLPDDKLCDVIRAIEDVGFTLTDLDTLGAAFEAFFGSIFRGELGQYFTRRELARFTCALLKPTEEDIALDPTAGSGGFLLELLVQVWHRIDRNYAGRPDQARLKLEFASKRLYGIEIHDVLGRVCQTNLLLHKDGHTNIEVDRTCLDVGFTNPRIQLNKFTIVVGNPPFGDAIKQRDTDKLGASELADFGLSDAEQVDSEIVILVRAAQFLAPGGRLGMVVPDGVLNNTGEQSRCPWLRRYLLRTGRILAVVSLPDFAFRKAGAQNKTSILFWQRFTVVEGDAFEETFRRELRRLVGAGPADLAATDAALDVALQEHGYSIFLAEAEQIGFTAAGSATPTNELFLAPERIPDDNDTTTVLGQYRLFCHDPHTYTGSEGPDCMSLPAGAVFRAHPSHRMDPKYHLFRREMFGATPAGMTRHKLGTLLERRRDPVVPSDQPDVEFQTLTLTQEGELAPREAGLGTSPPAWFGTYFKPDVKWFRVHAGDLLLSRIDIWKGSVSIVPAEFDGAIVTLEFPVYRVREQHLDPHYLKLLLRTPYFRRAIRSITTGHSNRRRTQDDDFESLEVFLPDPVTQARIAHAVREQELHCRDAEVRYQDVLERAEAVIMGELSVSDFFGEG